MNNNVWEKKNHAAPKIPVPCRDSRKNPSPAWKKRLTGD
jgi:hypothetical protein